MTIEAQTVPATLHLPPVLDLAAAEGLQAELVRELQETSSLRLDASAVETLTTPCAQLILSAARTHDVRIRNPSDAFAGAFADLGLRLADCAEPAGEAVAAGSAAAIVSIVESAPSEPAEPAAIDQIDESAMAKRILTIDDSKTMRDMLMLTLRDAGFDVIQAVDGEDGVSVLKQHTVDVVITDINMPKMDGYEVIRQLRGDPQHKTLPILVLTTESDTDKRGIARAAGATGWMVKPFDPERLVQTIRKVSP
jgi:two-component system chemotaxis response regulator CheY